MALSKGTHECLSADVRVNFCRVEANMPQKLLDDADVCAMIEHVRCEAMAQHVRSNPRQPRPNSKDFENTTYSSSA